MKFCECGCGQPTKVARETSRRDGQTKGLPVRFVQGHHSRRVGWNSPPVLVPCACGCESAVKPPSRFSSGHNNIQRAESSLGDRLSNWTEETDTGCHLWGASLDKSGYGFLSIGGRRIMAHRLRYEREVGAIPIGSVLSHAGGRRPQCCNPIHYAPRAQKVDTESQRVTRNASSRAYAKRHSDRVRTATARTRARRRSAPGVLSRDIVRRLLEAQSGNCASCYGPLASSGYQLDHIYPLSRGGHNVDANVQLLCPHCNNRKGSRTPEEWESFSKREIMKHAVFLAAPAQ